MKVKLISIKNVPKILALTDSNTFGFCKFRKVDGTLRKMWFTVYIAEKHLNGNGGRYVAKEHGLTVVRDIEKEKGDCIRTISWSRVVSISVNKVKYKVKK